MEIQEVCRILSFSKLEKNLLSDEICYLKGRKEDNRLFYFH
jgi:hypothetical protein